MIDIAVNKVLVTENSRLSGLVQELLKTQTRLTKEIKKERLAYGILQKKLIHAE